MTEIQKYLAEEVAEDHADGIITRREAMRRLGAARGGRGDGVDDAGGRGAGQGRRRRPRARPGHGGGQGGGHGGGDDGSDRWAPVASEPITFAGPAAR